MRIWVADEARFGLQPDLRRAWVSRGIRAHKSSRRDPWALHALLWDGAGFHPENGHPRLPENVVVLRQPPYSPELNPVEKLWDMLRDGLCNRNWRNLEHLLEQAARWLRAFWSDPARLFSLVGRGWLLDQANA